MRRCARQSPGTGPLSGPRHAEYARRGRGLRWARACLLAGCPLPATLPQTSLESAVVGQRDAHASERAFIEVDAPRQQWLLGERLTVRVRFGIERTFLEQLQPLFQRPLTLPVQVLAPWVDDPDGRAADAPSTPLAPGADGSGAASLALNESIARARPVEERRIDERPFAVWEFERTLVPERSGPLELAGTALRLAYATEFREELFVDPVATDTRIALVPGPSLTLEVERVPESGRPVDFAGAIGSFSVAAELDRAQSRIGEALQLTLRVDGQGNFGLFEPPRPGTLEGFRLGTASVSGDPERLVVRWSITPQAAGSHEIGPIRLSYLDPGPPVRYASASTTPLRVEVLPGAEVPRQPNVPRPDRPSVSARTGEEPGAPLEESGQARTGMALIGTVLAGLAGLAGLVFFLRRGREADRVPRGPSPSAAALLAQADEPEVDLGQLMCDYLAQQLACAPAAVVGPRLTARLVAAGVPDDLAARTAGLLEAWIGARYGGQAPAAGPGLMRDLVGELEHAFHASKR